MPLPAKQASIKIFLPTVPCYIILLAGEVFGHPKLATIYASLMERKNSLQPQIRSSA